MKSGAIPKVVLQAMERYESQHDPGVGEYLLRELLWELSRWNCKLPGFTDVPPDALEVVAYSAYDVLQIRTRTGVIDCRLDWNLIGPPEVNPI
jgi:hypothetical protein